ncbi:ATP-binding cassette domain-containing protein, partial [Vineibacter terrae]|uniref:ATP-binding cassette domain-containing protein n=1 Tax=Vineibacter terrae TaxID=2586908 RepID=UPI002E32B3A1
MNAPSPGAPPAPLLDVRGLQKFFPITQGLRQRVVAQVRAVDGVDFTISEGETLGLVGESGCGKTTASRCILRAIDPTGGAILYRTRDGRTVDLAALSPAALRPLRAEIQMIFQDPFSSLNPRMTLLDNVGEPLLVNGVRNRRERAERVAELLRLVG